MTTVLNLGTGDEQVFDLEPARAVIAAHEQNQGNNNTWTFPAPEKHPEFSEGKRCVSCGDFAALKN